MDWYLYPGTGIVRGDLPMDWYVAGLRHPSSKPKKYAASVRLLYFWLTPDHSGRSTGMAVPSTVARNRRHCGKSDHGRHPGLDRVREL